MNNKNRRKMEIDLNTIKENKQRYLNGLFTFVCMSCFKVRVFDIIVHVYVTFQSLCFWYYRSCTCHVSEFMFMILLLYTSHVTVAYFMYMTCFRVHTYDITFAFMSCFRVHFYDITFMYMSCFKVVWDICQY